MKKLLSVLLVLIIISVMSACAKTPTDFSSADVLSSKEARTAETESNTGSKEEISTAENKTASDVSSQGVPSKEREEHQENTNSYDDYTYDFQYTFDDDYDAESSDYSQTNSSNIECLDALNFYAGKKYLQAQSLLPLSGQKYYYEINPTQVFTITMATYFTVNLNDENGFLAQKLGGTGLVEVVATENSLEDMVTFKRGDKYFSCLLNGKSWNQDSTNSLASQEFSTHKYIEGFNIVKNLEQENFEFTVYYENARVTKLECARSDNGQSTNKYNVDNVTLNEDLCIVMFTKLQFTIEQIENYMSQSEKTESEM